MTSDKVSKGNVLWGGTHTGMIRASRLSLLKLSLSVIEAKRQYNSHLPGMTVADLAKARKNAGHSPLCLSYTPKSPLKGLPFLPARCTMEKMLMKIPHRVSV